MTYDVVPGDGTAYDAVMGLSLGSDRGWGIGIWHKRREVLADHRLDAGGTRLADQRQRLGQCRDGQGDLALGLVAQAQPTKRLRLASSVTQSADSIQYGREEPLGLGVTCLCVSEHAKPETDLRFNP